MHAAFALFLWIHDDGFAIRGLMFSIVFSVHCTKAGETLRCGLFLALCASARGHFLIVRR